MQLMAKNHKTRVSRRKKSNSEHGSQIRNSGGKQKLKHSEDTLSARRPANITPAEPQDQNKRAPRLNINARLPETIPLILETQSNSEYALLDSGQGRKLERYGPYIIDRPEAQAFWQCERDNKFWARADAIFDSEKDEEGMGRWKFPHTPLGETWPLFWNGTQGRLDYHGRFTSFRHVGVFPEQAAHWHFIEDQIGARAKKSKPPKLLNLFGYTGIASLVAAQAGANVTHVDASKKAIGWAKENQQMAKLQDKPIRWICDDAVKFCERELRRNNQYDAIILDPPKYGRGPKGEVWQLFDSLPHMIDLCRKLVSDDPVFVILTSYSIRSSFYAMHELMQETFGDCPGEVQSGELILRTLNSKRALSTSLFSRWIASQDKPT